MARWRRWWRKLPVVIMIVAVAFMIALFDGAVSKYFTIYDTALWGVFICKNGETDFQIL